MNQEQYRAKCTMRRRGHILERDLGGEKGWQIAQTFKSINKAKAYVRENKLRVYRV